MEARLKATGSLAADRAASTNGLAGPIVNMMPIVPVIAVFALKPCGLVECN